MRSRRRTRGNPFEAEGIRLVGAAKAARSDVWEIVAEYERLRGRLPFMKQKLAAAKHAKSALRAGYTKKDVIGCLRWMHTTPPFSEWDNWTLAAVVRNLPRWKKKQRYAQTFPGY